MMTNSQANNQEKIDQPTYSGSNDDVSRPYGDFYDTESIRIMKNGGFYGVTLPIMRVVASHTTLTAEEFTTPFFIANRTYRVIKIIERHEVAGNGAGDVTLQVIKVKSGESPASGKYLLETAFNLKATANTNQTGTIVTSATTNVFDATLQSGDALSLESSGTLTTLEGVTVSVLLKAI